VVRKTAVFQQGGFGRFGGPGTLTDIAGTKVREAESLVLETEGVGNRGDPAPPKDREAPPFPRNGAPKRDSAK